MAVGIDGLIRSPAGTGVLANKKVGRPFALSHVVGSYYGANECLRIKHGLKNHALKTNLYMKTIRDAFDQLQKLKTA